MNSTTLAIENFKIELEPKKYSGYKPGQNIKGKLVIKNTDYIACRAIRVALEGTAVVAYKSEKSQLRRTKIENLFVSEVWANVFLVKSPTEEFKRPYLLTKSTHEFPFTIPIKKMDPFPGTFKAKYGEIEYNVVGYIDNFYIKSPTTVSKIVNIKSHLNLRTIPLSVHPVEINGRTRLSPLHEKLKFTFQLSRTSFIAKEEIPFKLTLIDVDPRDLEKFPTVCVSLLRKIIFKTDESSRCIRKTLDTLVNSVNDWNFVDRKTLWIVEWIGSLNIPEDAEIPTFSEEVMQCLYSFKLEMKTDSSISPCSEELPITIGTTRKKSTAKPN